jgi:hypothetical protein
MSGCPICNGPLKFDAFGTWCHRCGRDPEREVFDTKTRMFLHNSFRHEELDRLLEKAKQHIMTPEEIKEQRYSWVRGEMLLEHPEMTPAEFNKIWLEIGQEVPESRKDND